MPADTPSPAPRWMSHTVAAEEAGRTVEEILRGPLGASRRRLQTLTRSRGIRLNRRPAHLSRKVRAGDVVTARLGGPEQPRLEAVRMPLDIRYEDADVLVIDKPAGLLVHPTSPAQTRTLAHGVAARFPVNKVRPVHRLDRDTSGLVIFAKSAAAQTRLDEQLRAGTLGREYLAFVRGTVEGESGTVDAPIGRHPTQRQLRAVTPNGDAALTRWEVVERFAGATLLRLALETGRTHQIRVHLAHLGYPVLGDRPYGGGRAPGRPALHAARLSFRQPENGEPIQVDAELPPDLAALGEELRAE